MRRLPLFPLPGVVLMPGTMLPLHIFEPRYRAMVADALLGDRLIGMAMLRQGEEGGDGTLPRIHRIGGAGEIIESELLEDGRYNILLEGRFRYRVVEEPPAGPYRVARVEEVPSLPFPDADEESRVIRAAEALFSDMAAALELPPLPQESLSSERMVSEIALRLRYAPAELQSLLETDSVATRFETVAGRMLEWKARLRFLAPFRTPDLDPRRN